MAKLNMKLSNVINRNVKNGGAIPLRCGAILFTQLEAGVTSIFNT
jgi:hypothetical protein